MDNVSQLLQTDSMSMDSASIERTDSTSTERTGSTSTGRALGFVIMATSVKTDRDTAVAALRQALRRLGSLTTEKHLQSAMVTAKQKFMEVFRLHGLYYLEKGEDQGSGANMEWEDSVGDAYNEAYTAAEDKLEVLSQANQPVEVTAKAKLRLS
jgi:hypothetical protein